jgi:hypothetical protein
VKVTRVDADRFGHAGAGSRQEEQKSPIAPTAVCRLIRGCDDGLDLGVGEVVRHLDVSPLGGDCQNALGDAEGGGVGGSDVMEEGSNSGKAGIEGDVAGRDCVVRYKRNGRLLAAASIYRDVQSLEAELALEADCAASKAAVA